MSYQGICFNVWFRFQSFAECFSNAFPSMRISVPSSYTIRACLGGAKELGKLILLLLTLTVDVPYRYLSI